MFFSERSDFDEVNYKCSARVLTYSTDERSKSRECLHTMHCKEEEDQRSNSASPRRFTTVGIFLILPFSG